MKLVVVGLSLSSSWGNGHATTYRSLLKAFAALGHEVTFLERDVPWYAGAARDLARPDFCRLIFYRDLDEFRSLAASIAGADAVMVGSYVPDGISVGDFVQSTARGIKAFYDIDTPVTMASLAVGTCTYLQPSQIGDYDVYLSFTGGPMLDRIRTIYGARDARPLYCCADPDVYQPRDCVKRWDLSYLGTYSPDRQPVLERLLIEPAKRAAALRFVVAGPQYPVDIEWPANVERIEHVGPRDHAAFYGASRFTLNVTRADMIRAGYSPSVRLFEAGACAAAIISDRWEGLEEVLTPGVSVLLADRPDEVLSYVTQPDDAVRLRLGQSARAQVLAAHTAMHRARQLETAFKPCVAA